MATNEAEKARRIEDLVHRLEQIVDPVSREIAEQLMQAVLDLHGSGLEKMMELVFESGASGEAIIRRFANDSLVSSLLVLHNLHPDDVETRVRHVLAKVPGHVELVHVIDNVARIRISDQSDEATLKAMLHEAVPDLADIVVQYSAVMDSFVPLLSIGGMASRAS